LSPESVTGDYEELGEKSVSTGSSTNVLCEQITKLFSLKTCELLRGHLLYSKTYMTKILRN